jgi:hypothetical protein
MVVQNSARTAGMTAGMNSGAFSGAALPESFDQYRPAAQVLGPSVSINHVHACIWSSNRFVALC